MNPYALLNCNFESKFYNRDICMYKNADDVARTPSEHSSEPGPEDKLSNFTYDKFKPKNMLNNGLKDSLLVGSMDDNGTCQSPMGSLP